MAVKKGQFVSKNGHTYEVRLSGNSVEGGDILLGVPPVTISMAAGEHKFCGFKSTTAIVNILTDVPLLDLYAQSATDVRLTVEDKAASTIEFDGYVTPFAFDQPYTGKLDSVQVNAVDLISARKEAKYENVGATHGVDLNALTIVQEICRRAGITRIVQHLNYNVDKGESPFTKVAQAGFLQGEVSDADALSAICKFYGYTSTVVGQSLYLFDEHVYVNGIDEHTTDAIVYGYSEGSWKIYLESILDSTSPIRLQAIGSAVRDMSVSVERAYDGIQITAEGPDTSILLPDVCAEENTTENTDALGNNTRKFEVYDGDGDFIQWRTPRGNKVMDFGHSKIDGSGFNPISQGHISDGDPLVPFKEYNSEGEVIANPRLSGAALFFKLVNAKRAREDDIITYSIDKDVNVIWLTNSRSIIKSIEFVGEQKKETRFSHTGGYFKVNLEWFETPYDKWAYLDIKPSGHSFYKIDSIRCANIQCGNAIFLSDDDMESTPTWGDETAEGVVGESKLMTDGEKLKGTLLGISKYANEAILKSQNSGQIYINLRWLESPLKGITTRTESSNIFITSLSMESVGDEINTEHADMRHSFNGGDDYLEVGTMLTTRDSGSIEFNAYGVNARPGIVPTKPYRGYYRGGGQVQANIAGVLMVQLKARYGQPHAAYKMTVDGNIKPYAGVVFNDKTYTVEAYDRDVYNDTTTITID